MSKLSAAQLKALVRSGQLPASSARKILQAGVGGTVQIDATVGQKQITLTATTLSRSGDLQPTR
jgi:hypothetical protein